MTKSYIIDFIKKNGPSRPHDIIQFLKITPAATHRQLKELVSLGIIEKIGKAPKVYYQLPSTQALDIPQIKPSTKNELEQHYLYIDPSGNRYEGHEGFYRWCLSKKLQKQYTFLAEEYCQLRASIYKNQKKQFINATQRMNNIFDSLALDKVFYEDFYSLPKFGKTKLGQLVLHGKQAQNKKIINEIQEACKPTLLTLIKNEKINSLAWTPHSLPRKIPFLKELASLLNFSLPTIDIIKAYKGEMLIAQKSLNKIEDRIQNARDTIIVAEPKIEYKNILLIDDAIGSGATLNETAKKLKTKGAKKIIGYAVVGSYKGFEVIKEV